MLKKQCLKVLCIRIVVVIIALIGFFLAANLLVKPIVVVAENHAVEFITPELKAICACESVGDWSAEPKHWDSNGNVLRGRKVPDDIGQCQINQYYHGETAKKMGINIFSFNGNRQFANYLYNKNGTRDWSASKSCWDK